MKSNLRFRVLVIVGVILVCIYGIIGIPTSLADISANWKKSIRLGTDLKGGSQLVLEVQVQDAFMAEADAVIERIKEATAKAGIEVNELSRTEPKSLKEADSIQINARGVNPNKVGEFRTLVNDQFGGVWILNSTNNDFRMTLKPTEAKKLREATLTLTKNTIEKKVNALGLAETSVQERGGSSDASEIMVVLPGVDNPAHVKQILKTAAQLELLEVLGGPFPSREEAMSSKGGVLPLNSQILPSVSRGGNPPEWWLVARAAVVTGRDVRDARPQQDPNTGVWETTFVLSQDSAKRFEAFTAKHYQNRDRLAIVIDRRVLSAPTIEGKISDNGRIMGLSGREEAQDLGLNLRAGALPARVEYGEERSVGASLGNDSIKAGMLAGIAGVIAVVLVMLVYYRGSGINAFLALILNALILIAALAYFNAVLTLPGIAGVILTIGMAVDSNVLIFERIREEIRAGKAVIAAVDAGFNKAFLTIIDTHVTTVVSCAFLFLFGTGPVKGFAVTLVIGLIANVFTAVFVSRTIFDWELGRQRGVVTLSI